MKRFFARNTTTTLTQDTKAALFGSNAALMRRTFASSPQKNPYASILTKLSVGNSQFSYYKLPALQDKRIGKN